MTIRRTVVESPPAPATPAPAPPAPASPVPSLPPVRYATDSHRRFPMRRIFVRCYRTTAAIHLFKRYSEIISEHDRLSFRADPNSSPARFLDVCLHRPRSTLPTHVLLAPVLRMRNHHRRWYIYTDIYRTHARTSARDDRAGYIIMLI